MTERDALREIAMLLSGHRHKWARAAWQVAVDTLAAQGIEAGTAETGTGSVHESPVAESDAPNPHQYPRTISHDR